MAHYSQWNWTYWYDFRFITARNEVGAMLCFYTCLWFCSREGGGWYPSMHCRWYPSMPCSRSPGEGGIPACLTGFQAHTHTQGGSWGVWPVGVSRPTPKGVVEGSSRGGLQAHTWGGVPAPGGVCCSGGLLQNGVQTPSPMMATATGGTHPTGMHSCFTL